jgi:integrase
MRLYCPFQVEKYMERIINGLRGPKNRCIRMPFDIEIIKTVPERKVKGHAQVKKIPGKNYYNQEKITYFYFNEFTDMMEVNKKLYYRLVYLFLFETAARIEEARAVKIADVNMDQNRVTVNTLKQRSESIARVLPISDKLKSLILQHQVDSGLGKNDFVLAKEKGKKPITQQGLSWIMKRDCDNLGIDRIKGHCHTWRHTRAIQLLDSGINIVQLQRLLGHSSIQNTVLYLKYSDKQFVDSVRKGNEAIGLR